ncbi:MAG: V-type ATPase subunit [Candidatus Muiribacteriota bacterium]
MTDSRYAHIYARIKSLENKMLGNRDFIRLAEAEDKSKFSSILSDTAYDEDFEKIDINSFYYKKYAEFRNFMLKSLPGEKFLDVYFSAEDFNNIKLYVKSDKIDFHNPFLLKEEDFKHFIEHGSGQIPEPFLHIITEVLKLKEKSIFEAEIYIDSEKFKWFLTHKNSFWRKYIKNQIDFLNFRLVFRAKNLDISADIFEKCIIDNGYIEKYKVVESFKDKPENIHKYFMRSELYKDFVKLNDIIVKENDFAQFEKEVDNALLSVVKNSKYVSLSEDNVIAYVLAVEYELKNLKMIFEGKSGSVPQEVIKERLRESYV